jgi:glycosyltransferase involved in cell wall biosynthesis
MARTPDVSVVVPTRNRVERLTRLLDSLRTQNLSAGTFEVIVVDDCSSDSTPVFLQSSARAGDLDLRSMRLDQPHGVGAARNAGWAEARAPIVAFIDDDCVATPGWLEAGLGACRQAPGAFVQGRTDPIPEEADQLGLFSYTIRVEKLGPHFETCNIFYPRDILERHGGFDNEAFPGRGSDFDFAWTVIEAGARPVFAPNARVHHAVQVLGPLGQLRRAAGWSQVILVFARHSGARRARLYRGVYWEPQHRLLLRAAVGVFLPRRLGHLRSWLIMPYLKNFRHRLRDAGAAPALAPYLVALDLVETGAVIGGALRYHTPVI